MNKARYLVFLVLPIVFVYIAFYLADATGPYWLGSNSDPEYAYLMNGLSIAKSLPVGHTDHPGTPVQLIGSMAVILTHLFRAEPDVIQDVISSPELYLGVMHVVLVGLNVATMFLMGLIAYNITHQLWIGLLLQSAPFFSRTLLHQSTTRVTPEPLLLFAASLLTMMLLLILFKRDYQPKDVAAFGIISGFGLATKLTFFPLLIIPFLVLPRVKPRLIYLLVITGTFVVFTLPIIRQYRRLFQWIKDLLIHSGRYGSGESNVIESAKILSRIRNLFDLEPAFFIALAIGVATLLIVLFIANIKRFSVARTPLLILCGLLMAQILQMLVIAKDPATHYLVPALALLPVTLLASFRLLGQVELFHNTTKVRWLYLAVPVLALILASKTSGETQTLINRLAAQRDRQLAVYNIVQKEYKEDIVITYFRASSPQYALSFGNGWANRSFANNLNRLYPDAYSWDIWSAKFHQWNSQAIELQTIVNNRGNRKVLLQGTPFDHYEYISRPEYRPNVHLVDLIKGQNETIYLVNTE